MSLIETRGHQLFPVLDAGQIETAKRFASGPARAFATGEIAFYVGQRPSPPWLVLGGSMWCVAMVSIVKLRSPAFALGNSRANSATSPGGNRLPVAARVRKAASRYRSTRRMCVP